MRTIWVFLNTSGLNVVTTQEVNSAHIGAKSDVHHVMIRVDGRKVRQRLSYADGRFFLPLNAEVPYVPSVLISRVTEVMVWDTVPALTAQAEVMKPGIYRSKAGFVTAEVTEYLHSVNHHGRGVVGYHVSLRAKALDAALSFLPHLIMGALTPKIPLGGTKLVGKSGKGAQPDRSMS